MTFWEKAIGGAVPPVPSSAPAMPRAWWDVPSNPSSVQIPDNQVMDLSGKVIPGAAEYTTTRAPSARHTDRCPQCDSGNYVGDSGNRSTGSRCFECGYNGRFDQQAYTTTGGANVVATKQAASTSPTNVGAVFQHMG